MPGINDAPEQVEQILELATEAGAVAIGGRRCTCAATVRGIFLDWLRSYRPDLVPRYERLYARGAYVPERERRAIERAAGCRARASASTRSASSTGRLLRPARRGRRHAGRRCARNGSSEARGLERARRAEHGLGHDRDRAGEHERQRRSRRSPAV